MAWARHAICESAFNIQFENLQIQNVLCQTEDGVKSATLAIQRTIKTAALHN
jgi:hypothetical protein